MQDPTLYVPFEDDAGKEVSDDEYVYMKDVVFADGYLTVADVVAGCYDALRQFRDSSGLLGLVPRHWADGMLLDPSLFRRLMARVRESARSEAEVVRIVDEELDRWRRKHSSEAWPVVVTEEGRRRWAARGLTIDRYWLITKRWP
jgi:hypothetical protein